MKTYTHEEVLDRVIGAVGSAQRTQYEEELQTLLMGDAIRHARQSKNLTQEQLGELMGIKRAQVSRIENGHNLNFSTIARAFKAMGISASFDVSGIGRVALW